MNNAAIIIVNYNMPERTDALCTHIINTVKQPYDFYVVDNASDLIPPSKFSNVFLQENKQTTGGMLAGINAAKKSNTKYSYFWFFITSTEFYANDDTDILEKLQLVFDDDPDTYAVSPSVTFNTSAWEQWMSPREKEFPRRVWGIDYLAALVDTKKFFSLGGFRPELTMAWGLFGELNWKARKAGYHIYVHDGCIVHKETNIGYTMDRMNMGAKDRTNLASKESDSVLTPIYGEDYRERFRYEYTELGANGDY